MTYKLDSIDLGILESLQQNSNISSKKLSIIFHRSTSVIYERIRNLEEQGFITGYKAVLDHNKISSLFISHTKIQLNDHSGDALSSFEKEITAFNEVVECSHITGDFDFYIKIVVTSMRYYDEFLNQKLARIPNVGKVLSYAAISEKKRVTEYPIVK